jgi:hypothetical protein
LVSFCAKPSALLLLLTVEMTRAKSNTRDAELIARVLKRNCPRRLRPLICQKSTGELSDEKLI